MDVSYKYFIFLDSMMNFDRNFLKLFLLTLALLAVKLNAKPMEDSRLSRLLESEEGDFEEPLEYIPIAPARLVRRSALDSDIFGTTYRWRKRRYPH